MAARSSASASRAIWSRSSSIRTRRWRAIAARLPGDATHPRYYGSFPRVLGRYVREQQVLTWEEAIRKMTGLPAATIGLVNRGAPRAGHGGRHRHLRPEQHRRSRDFRSAHRDASRHAACPRQWQAGAQGRCGDRREGRRGAAARPPRAQPADERRHRAQSVGPRPGLGGRRQRERRAESGTARAAGPPQTAGPDLEDARSR